MPDPIRMSDKTREALRLRLQLLRDSVVTPPQCELIDDIAAILGVSLRSVVDPKTPRKKGDAFRG